VKVTVTLDVRGKSVPVDKISDATVRAALEQMGRDVGKKLAHAKCPTHASTPTDVRLHVSASGNADLKYESCCEKLKEAVSKAL
jgi:hypothetical protein